MSQPHLDPSGSQLLLVDDVQFHAARRILRTCYCKHHHIFPGFLITKQIKFLWIAVKP